MLAGSTVLVTGCSRGLGLEMTRQLLTRKVGKVVATCRQPQHAEELGQLAEQHPESLYVARLDVTDLDSFTVFSETVARICGTEGIHVLLNNAGVAPKSTRINMVTAEQMTTTFLTNVTGPLMLTKALLPLLGQGAQSREQDSLVVNLSSILGSIAENTKQGGLYPYRSSKAGLNAVTKSLSLDLAPLQVGALAVHPGWVQTDMGGKQAPLTAQESVSGVLDVVENYSRDQSGGFLDHTGATLPW